MSPPPSPLRPVYIVQGRSGYYGESRWLVAWFPTEAGAQEFAAICQRVSDERNARDLAEDGYCSGTNRLDGWTHPMDPQWTSSSSGDTQYTVVAVPGPVP